jgi:hypothetical protein
LAQALFAATAITNEDARATALTTLLPLLPPSDQPAVLAQALAAATAITNKYDRAYAPTALARLLATTPVHDAHFARTLRILARYGRPALLEDVATLMPWITALAERNQQPAALVALANTIIETAHCWP